MKNDRTTAQQSLPVHAGCPETYIFLGVRMKILLSSKDTGGPIFAHRGPDATGRRWGSTLTCQRGRIDAPSANLALAYQRRKMGCRSEGHFFHSTRASIPFAESSFGNCLHFTFSICATAPMQNWEPSRYRVAAGNQPISSVEPASPESANYLIGSAKARRGRGSNATLSTLTFPALI